MSDAPGDLPGLDPEEFVGEPPTGEEDPVAFTSGDQSTGDSGDAGESKATESADAGGEEETP
jgi:hypothetical protein